MMALLTSSRHISYAAQILPGWLIVGVGVGFALPTLISSATQDLADHQAATGSAVVTMAGQIGSVVGVSLLVIFLAFTGHSGDPHHNFAAAWLLAAGLMLLSAVTALTMTHRPIARATP
jgi:MFS family permease